MERPVLYLDLDDTIISWSADGPRGALGASEFIGWALERFEVRWLTTWCPSGVMDEGLLLDLARMVERNPAELTDIRGCEWQAEGSKLNGIAWVEHTVLGRPFLWLEDDYGFTGREREFLSRIGFLSNYHHCNVTEDPYALLRAHAWMRRWRAGLVSAAA